MSETLTPSQQIIADANRVVTVHDAKGREIQIRRVTGRNMARFIRICGGAADIATYFGEAVLRASVVSVDGMPIPFPKSADEVDALWDRVDMDAAQAAADWFRGQVEPETDKNPLA